MKLNCPVILNLRGNLPHSRFLFSLCFLSKLKTTHPFRVFFKVDRSLLQGKKQQQQNEKKHENLFSPLHLVINGRSPNWHDSSFQRQTKPQKTKTEDPIRKQPLAASVNGIPAVKQPVSVSSHESIESPLLECQLDVVRISFDFFIHYSPFRRLARHLL